MAVVRAPIVDLLDGLICDFLSDLHLSLRYAFFQIIKLAGPYNTNGSPHLKPHILFVLGASFEFDIPMFEQVPRQLVRQASTDVIQEAGLFDVGGGECLFTRRLYTL